MKITIIGGGKVGTTIAEQLAGEDHDITLIDHNAQVAEQISNTLDIMTVCGSGGSLETLRAADVGDSDLLVACTTSDELNLVCCIFAKKLGCGNTIARVRNPEYAQQIYFIKDELNLSTTINPEMASAREIFRMLEIPGVLRREAFAGERVEIVEIGCDAGDVLDGLSLMNISKKIKIRVLVGAVRRGDEVFIPHGDFTLRAGDKIYICAPATQVANILRGIGWHRKKAKNVAVIGASKVANYLISMLLKTGTNIKLIERDKDKAAAFAEKFADITVVCADGSSGTVLKSERVDMMDAVIALTNIDEENLIMSMYLSSTGVSQVIAKADHIEYADMFADIGIDRIVSPKKLSAYEIVRYVRAMQNTHGSAVVTMHHLVDGKVEALEFNVTDATRNRNVMLKDMSVRENVLIACINRMGRIIIPNGDDSFETGDTVIIVTTGRRIFLDLNDIFLDGE